MTNASAKKRELFYHGVSPTSQLVVDFELQGAEALAELFSRRFGPVKILPVDPPPLHKPSSIAPRHVKLVLDFITEHPSASAGGAELAAISGVSLRSLQAGFRRFAGMSIAAYQRQVRLESARKDLDGDSAVPNRGHRPQMGLHQCWPLQPLLPRSLWRQSVRRGSKGASAMTARGTDKILHHYPSGPGMFRPSVTSGS